MYQTMHPYLSAINESSADSTCYNFFGEITLQNIFYIFRAENNLYLDIQTVTVAVQSCECIERYSDKVFYLELPRGVNINENMNVSTQNSSKSLLTFLMDTEPSYIQVVPPHWLKLDAPSYYFQIFIAVAFLVISIPANIGHILVFLSYAR